MDVKIEKITPELAQEYLKRNAVNRKPSQLRINAFAYDMQHGAWQLNGEAIRFDSSGNLRDGQHRLYAIAKSGVPIEICVMRGIDDSVSIYDRGRSRSTYDALIISGFDKDLANNVNVAVAKLHYSIQLNQTFVSDYLVELFIKNHAETLRNLSPISGKNHHKSSANLSTKSASLILACLYAIESGEDLNDIFDFCKVYRTGLVENRNQSAAIVCRNDVIGNNIRMTGSSALRIKAEFVFEKGIYDFCQKYPRTKTYKNVNKPTYSNNLIFKEVI